MKKILIVLMAALVFACTITHGQDTDAAAIFANTTAQKQQRATFYQVEGYSVFDAQEAMPFVEKGIRKLNKKFNLSDNVSVVVDSFEQTPVARVVDVVDDNGVKLSKLYYYFKENKEKIRVIGFAAVLPRDTVVEHFFLKRVLERSMPDSVFTGGRADSVLFAGRKFAILPTCGWIEMNNVQCSQQGQMNWTTHRTYDRAAQMTKIQYDINSRKALYAVQEEKEVSIILEGQRTTAKKVTYKVKLPNSVMGSNVLFVYYTTTLIRDRYVSCILSYYDNQGDDKSLPFLLRQVMKVE